MTAERHSIACSFEVRPLTCRIGAEVAGLDLSAELEAAQVDRVHAALLRWKVLFFRRQHIGLEEQRRFAGYFGALTGAHVDEDALDPDARLAQAWRTDLSFLDRPPVAAVVRVVDAPDVGGDTLWSNTAAAYEELSPELQILAASLEVAHASEVGGVCHEAVHPVVRVLPETREHALLLGGFARRIVGLSSAESTALLTLFREGIESPENTVRWRWRAGDVALWDNRATQTRTVRDLRAAARLLHRVHVAGERPTRLARRI